jgi:hypothetical protein
MTLDSGARFYQGIIQGVLLADIVHVDNKGSFTLPQTMTGL